MSKEQDLLPTLSYAEKKVISSRRREKLASQFLAASIAHHGLSENNVRRQVDIREAIQAADKFIKVFDQ